MKVGKGLWGMLIGGILANVVIWAFVWGTYVGEQEAKATWNYQLCVTERLGYGPMDGPFTRQQQRDIETALEQCWGTAWVEEQYGQDQGRGQLQGHGL